MTGKPRLSVFERLGPTIPPDELPFSTSRRVHLQKGRGQSLSVVVTEAEPRPEAAPAAGEACTERDTRREPRVVRSRLLQQSLQQAERSRTRTSRQPQCGSPLEVCRSHPLAQQTVQFSEEQSPLGSDCSSGPRHSKGPRRQHHSVGTAARDGARSWQPPQGAGIVSDTAKCSAQCEAASAAEKLQRHTGPSPVAGEQLLLEQELQQRLEQSQAERRFAEELAEQVALQASRLMEAKARVQAEATALAQERDHLLERLEYMEQALQAREHSRGSSLTSSPVKGAAQDPQALTQQLLALQREREDLLRLLEARLGGLQLGTVDKDTDSLLTCN